MNNAGGAGEFSVSVPEFAIDWSDGSCHWTTLIEAPAAASRVAHFIGPDPVNFTFVAPSSSLNWLSITLATYMRHNTVTIIVTLYDGADRILAKTVVQPETIIDNAMGRVLDLDGVPFEVGSHYRVECVSPEAVADNGFAAWFFEIRGGCYQTPSHLIRYRNDRLFRWRPEERGLQPAPANPPVLVVFGAADERLATAKRGAELLSRAFPGQAFDVIEGERPDRLWPILQDADVVVLAEAHDIDIASPTGFDALCFELYCRGVSTIYLAEADLSAACEATGTSLRGGLAIRARQQSDTERRSRFILHGDTLRLEDMTQPADADVVLGLRESLANVVRRGRAGRVPRVCVVSVLYKKAGIVRQFVDQVIGQDFPGQIDLVLVDDCSPENEVQIVQSASQELAAAAMANRSITIITNTQNSGNCASRLAGLAACEADIYIVIDCDCLINTSFVSAHVFEHARPDVDVVIGPLNIEAGARNPMELLQTLEASPQQLAAESGMQDTVQPDGFLNCITRNFSVKRRQVQAEQLFDLDFSYSARPGSGFGWEDVEMGYRLYQRGAVIRFTDRAFSVHASHTSSIPDTLKVQGSINNFARLFDKHPDMQFVARRWAAETFYKIARWAEQEGVEGGAAMQSLRARFEQVARANAPLIAAYRPGARRLKVLTYRWHVPHQYELYKLPHDFTLVTSVGGNGMIDGWSYDQRPLRSNVRFLPFAAVNPQDYDVAILHFDENVLHPNLCNNVIPSSWGDPFFALLAISELPKVAICHGTPQFVGQYGLNRQRIERFSVHEPARQMLVELLAAHAVKVVCNSHQALAEWGFADAKVIWHGFDPQEFPAGSRTRDILALSPDRHRPHYRGAWEDAIVRGRLDPSLQIETAAHGGAPMEPRGTHTYAVRTLRAYVDRIRQFTFYLNTTLRSPMPRSRGEAMMTGVIPVSLRNHDVDRFIENGVNGFYSDDPAELADWINHVFRDRDRVHMISAAARRTAIDLFNHDRYLAAWQRLLTELADARSSAGARNPSDADQSV